VTEKLYRQDAEGAKEKKSFTAKGAKDTKGILAKSTAGFFQLLIPLRPSRPLR
jgi:hypothetical protein